jgi:predicted phosphodiesterase
MVIMKIGYFSDLYTEFLRPDAVVESNAHKTRHDVHQIGLETFGKILSESYAQADVIVAAGDIGTRERAVNFLKDAFKDRPVIYVSGNHDHWAGEYYSNIRKMKEAAAGSNVQVLHGGKTIEIDGVIFCGATLFTDYALFDRQESNLNRAAYLMNDHINIGIADQRRYKKREAMFEAQSSMNDFKKIRIRRNSAEVLNKNEVPRRITPQDLLGFHKRDVAAIKKAMTEAYETHKKLVVVTHHLPTAWSLLFDGEILEDYVYQKSDPCYASHLDYLFSVDEKPYAWIHGHSHIAKNFTINGVRVLSNPKGYGSGDDTGWKLGKMLDI